MVLYLMIKCHIVYLLLRIKSPIANSASDFPVHLLLNNLDTTTNQDQDGDVVGDTGQHWVPPRIIMRMRIKLVILDIGQPWVPGHYFCHHPSYESSLVDAVVTILYPVLP